MVIWSGRGISGVLISADGTVDTSRPNLLYIYPDPLPPTVQLNADIAFAGNEYFLVWSETVYVNPNSTTSMLKAMRLNTQLARLGGPVTLRTTGVGRPSVATDGQNFLVAAGNLGWLVANDGQVISAELALSTSGGAADICWDGMNYYIAGYKENYTLFAAKIAPNGRPAGNTEVELKRSDINLLVTVAPKPTGGVQVVWVTQQIYKPFDGAEGYYYSSDLDVLTAGMTANEVATPVSTLGVSAPRQSLPQMAASADGFLLTYRSEVSGDSRIMAIKLNADGHPVGTEPLQLDGGYPAITNPAVAWNGSSYLVVWENSDEPMSGSTTQQGTIYGKRIRMDGTAIDQVPFRISKGKNAHVASLNGEFLVISNYQFDGSVVATRINNNGLILQSSTISPNDVGLSGKMSLPRIATVGSRWLMVWTGIDSLGCNCVWGTFITPQLTVDKAFKISGPPGDCHASTWGFEPQIASSGDSALVVYRGRSTAVTEFDLLSTGGISARHIKADGSFADQSDRGFIVSPQGFVPSVAWDGFGYLINWLDPRNALYPKLSSGDIFAARIATDGSINDTNGFVLADSPLAEDKPTVAALNGIGVFAWAGFLNTSSHATMRIHLRTLRGAFISQPVAPTLLYSTVWSWDQVSLRWNDNSTNEDGFKIERCVGDNCTNFVPFATVAANTTSFTNTGLTGRTWYRYRVRAFNLAGESVPTNIESVLTSEPPSFSITGRLTDRDGRGLENYSIVLTGSQGGFARTDRSGYYRLTSVTAGGNYRVTVQSPGPRIGFTTYYPNPGWVEFNSLTSNQSANFAYNLTSPWVPPGATPTPTPTPRPTPTPTPPPGNDATILNPNFDEGGANWTTSGAVSFPNGIARFTPTTNYSPASIIQWVQLTQGATYEVSADITATTTTRLTFGVKFAEGENIIIGPSAPFTNVTRPTNVRVRLSVPSGVSQVGFFVLATGSVSSNSLATADNFRLMRVN
ncbi:MAG: carboxypeptidase regulatory-like domain-containing protein, partial [Acidobacteria bacterium]|nr:carboxypeptidase regulatory-like domain-containing protein [Acidobacteriota bacterium]